MEDVSNITEVIITFENVVRHEYFLVIYGILLYFTLLFAVYKDKEGKKGKLAWISFWKEYQMEFMIALMLAPLIVVFDDEMLGWYNGLFEKDIEFGKWFYLCAGMIGNFLYTLVKNLPNVREKLFRNANPNTQNPVSG